MAISLSLFPSELQMQMQTKLRRTLIGVSGRDSFAFGEWPSAI